MIESGEFWAGIFGVVVGGSVTTIGHLIVHHWQTADKRKRDDKRKAILIPTVIDQNPCAHLRMPRDMIFHGWSMRLFQAWQHSATMSS